MQAGREVTLDETQHNKAVFLDRDGVINKKRTDYVKTWKEFEFLDGIAEAIRIFSSNGYKVIVVTNQSAINRKLMTLDGLEQIHQNMIEDLDKHGATVDAIYYCPHTPDERCECRKPGIAMLRRAIQDFHLSPSDCILVGDSESDIQAGKAIGARTYLLEKESLLDIARMLVH